MQTNGVRVESHRPSRQGRHAAARARSTRIGTVGPCHRLQVFHLHLRAPARSPNEKYTPRDMHEAHFGGDCSKKSAVFTLQEKKHMDPRAKKGALGGLPHLTAVQ